MVKTNIFLFVVALAALSVDPALAQWASRENSPLVMESSHDKIFVHSDGSYDAEGDFEISVAKESGAEHMKLFRLPYDPNEGQLTVTEASTTNGAVILPVPAGMIDDKAVANGNEGMSSQHQITIAFPAVAVGSHLKVKMKRHMNPPYIPGLLNITISIAQEMFTNSDVTEIKSEVPLVVKHLGASDLVSVEQGKEGILSTVKVSLLRPTFRMLVEGSAEITENTLPRIEVGASGGSWAAMAKFFAAKLEAPLKEPLPAEFDAIVAEAVKEPTAAKKANVVMAKLIDKVKYLGDWRNERGYYLPRSLADIATTRQGDCKDFSFATVSMLHKLGIPATMALVHRGAENHLVALLTRSNRTFEPVLPGMNYFNHAILTAEIDGKKLWLDPTNPVAQVGEPFSDIADRSALILDASSAGLSKIPKVNGQNSLSVDRYYAFRMNGKADVMATVTSKGPQAADIKRLEAMMPEERRRFVLLSAVDAFLPAQFLGAVDQIEPEEGIKSEPGMLAGKFTYTLEGKGTKTSLGNSFQVSAPPGISVLMTPGAGRVTGIRLATDPVVETRRTALTNFQLQGDTPESCEVRNKWVKASRKFTKQSSAIEWVDRIEILVPTVPLVEAGSKAYSDFQKQVEKCFGENLLVYKWELPDASKPGFVPLPNWQIRNKSNIDARVTAIDEKTAQHYENYTYGRLLLNEVLQVAKDSKEAAAAIGSMSFAAEKQAYHSDLESDPVDTEDSKELNRLALQRDPNEVHANLVLAVAAEKSGAYATALSIYGKVLQDHPKSPGGNTGRWRVLLAKQTNKMMLEQETKNVASQAEAMIQDPSAICKSCFVSFLLGIYKQARNYDQVDRQFLRLIELDPKSAWNLLNYADFLNDRRRYIEAEDYARRSLKVAAVGMAHLQLGYALSNRALQEMTQITPGKNGISLCEEALEHDRSNRNCLQALSYVYDLLGARNHDQHLLDLAKEYKAADSAAEDSKAKQPSAPVNRLLLATLKGRIDRHPESEFTYALLPRQVPAQAGTATKAVGSLAAAGEAHPVRGSDLPAAVVSTTAQAAAAAPSPVATVAPAPAVAPVAVVPTAIPLPVAAIAPAPAVAPIAAVPVNPAPVPVAAAAAPPPAAAAPAPVAAEPSRAPASIAVPVPTPTPVPVPVK